MTDDWQELRLDELEGEEDLGEVTLVTLRPVVEDKNLRLDKFMEKYRIGHDLKGGIL